MEIALTLQNQHKRLCPDLLFLPILQNYLKHIYTCYLVTVNILIIFSSILQTKNASWHPFFFAFKASVGTATWLTILKKKWPRRALNIEAMWRIYASGNWVIIASDNGSSHIRCQTMIWTNAGILSIRPQINFFSKVRSLYLKCRLQKCPFCLSPNILTHWGRLTHICVSKLSYHWFR